MPPIGNELPINRDAVANVGNYARDFSEAQPYKHIRIDSFLDEDFATGLINEFPAFKSEETKTETGGEGRKLTKPNLSEHGPTFQKLAKMFASAEFLKWLSQLTSIEDLTWGGENLWGGGTHDNVNRAELDLHVDFNYDESSGLHRRINALIFLNREWETSWGGQSELAEDPWDPDNKNIKKYDPIWNRLILFETSERSWHGFPRIKIPAGKEHISRRSVAAYFYTKSRPANEVVGSHSTFYAQRHIPESVKPGAVLSDEDYKELRHIIKKRDTFLRIKQNKETSLSERVAAQRKRIVELEKKLRVPLVGYCRQIGEVTGFYSDDRMAGELKFVVRPTKDTSTISVIGMLPKTVLPGSPVELRCAGNVARANYSPGDPVSLTLSTALKANTDYELTVSSPNARSGKAAGLNADGRPLGLAITMIKIE